ncbi:MAG: putative type VI secretion system effector [Massilia sp.]
MTNFLSKPRAGNIVRLSGILTGYRCTRTSASFVYSQSDQQKMGVVAVAASLAGMGGQAASAAGFASDMEEPAEYVEFYLNGDAVKGWVWRSPFEEGDVVDVAAEWQGDHYESYGIARPADRMIALYPHCSRAKGRHIKNAIKWWGIWNVGFFGATAVAAVLLLGPDMLREPVFLWLSGFTALFWVLMFISLSSQYMPFVRLSEKVFNVLAIPDATNVDLVKSSKDQRTPEDHPEFGTFYFRY